MDSHCMYQNKATYLLAHKSLRFLSGDAFSLYFCKFRRVYSEYTMAWAQLALKGNGR